MSTMPHLLIFGVDLIVAGLGLVAAVCIGRPGERAANYQVASKLNPAALRTVRHGLAVDYKPMGRESA
jgi:hypothetical protein